MYMNMMFSTAYTDLRQKRTIASVIDAKNEFDAMIQTIVSNQGEDMREWLEKLPRKKKVFLNELLKIDLAVDVTPVP